MSAGHEVTELLVKWATGNQQALVELTPLAYAELRQLAAAYLGRERPDHTLQPTALVHEAYLRLIDQRNLSWQNRSHFFRVAAHLMREILVDHARRRKAAKRRGHKLPLEETVSFAHERSANLIALDEALDALAKLDTHKCQAVELRYFGGLNMEEIAETLHVSSATVRRDLRMAESWLYRERRSGEVERNP